MTASLAELSALSSEQACLRMGSSPAGLNPDEAVHRQQLHGPNSISREQAPSLLKELAQRAANPLNALLLALSGVSWALGDRRAALIVWVMVLLSIGMSFIQEHRSSAAAAELRSMVKTRASVRRAGLGSEDGFVELPFEDLVPGDVVRLSAGDMIPADLRLLEAKDLFVNQSVLTGEAMPAEKFVQEVAPASSSPLELRNLCFMGANVVSGYGMGLVVRTGGQTYFGSLADKLVQAQEETAFDRGIQRVVSLMLKVIAVMVPLVFLINGMTKHDWLQALMFAVAVAVGLTPEMLPMIVTVNLAKGALAMSRIKVIVKRLNAIQNLGAMDVLCTDKTGTLTQDRIILKRHLDMQGQESQQVLQWVWLNSHFQSGLRNLLDVAVLEHVDLQRELVVEQRFAKVDEIPFDFNRRRMSVVVSTPGGPHVLICKGAVEEVFAACTTCAIGDEIAPLEGRHFQEAQEQTRRLNEDGFRVIALAYRNFDPQQRPYSLEDERELTLLGYIAFLDPPKDSARQALAALADKGIAVKILTGDNDVVARKVCKEVGLKAEGVLLGPQLAQMSDEQLAEQAKPCTLFAKLSPDQKERIVRVLRQQGHVVGFLGDGINDSPALKAADVGISVDTAVDIARESADIILLEKSLMVLQQGVMEGRKVFANITKYIRMGMSSNFGNMFSVLGASLFLPFLPMAPIQVLTNNLLYDFSQAAIPTDRVDDSEIAQPRSWDVDNLFRFMVTIGPISSIFDYLTFALMLWVLHAGDDASLFQTGWFVESLLTQTLIIHIIRTAQIPFIQSRASRTLIASSVLICLLGISLPYTTLGAQLNLHPLPWAYWPALLAMLLGYAVLTHWAKRHFVRRWGL